MIFEKEDTAVEEFCKADKKELMQNNTSTEVLEEDEDGSPIKYRDKIMELSRKTNKAIAKRWDEALVSNG